MSAEGKESLTAQRVDKWLHHARLFKTRALATKACDKGNVKLGGQAVKASRLVRVGEVIALDVGWLVKELRVLGFATQRVGAPQVASLLEDLTPAERYEKAAIIRLEQALQRPAAHTEVGKPNKQQLRQLREWWGEA
jgi:ribosome-associated heat shock protein Hsp15